MIVKLLYEPDRLFCITLLRANCIVIKNTKYPINVEFGKDLLKLQTEGYFGQIYNSVTPYKSDHYKPYTVTISFSGFFPRQQSFFE